ncbi:hypothetical protein C4B68_17365 [Streptomyces dengpaensis]|uniref:Uncharacterized protein n=1 Tax=Streptomyces dengpaensis TaxID=2049881 RepID=A0ABM6SRB6_9ACTN|nr:hypothetical protein C4B68_17365 [Streptomyces dengpaensis]
MSVSPFPLTGTGRSRTGTCRSDLADSTAAGRRTGEIHRPVRGDMLGDSGRTKRDTGVRDDRG